MEFDMQPKQAEALRYLVSTVLVFGAIGGYILHERGERRAEVQAKEEARAQQAAAAKAWAAGAAARAEARAREADQRAREDAARVASLTPWERRQEALREQFSLWDGSHRAAEQAIKARMHNPASFAHIGTTYVDHGAGRGITVHTRFRGTNAFGAVVAQRAVVEVDAAGAVTLVRFVQ